MTDRTEHLTRANEKLGRHPITIKTPVCQDAQHAPVSQLLEGWDSAITIPKRTDIQRTNNAYKEANPRYGTRGMV